MQMAFKNTNVHRFMQCEPHRYHRGSGPAVLGARLILGKDSLRKRCVSEDFQKKKKKKSFHGEEKCCGEKEGRSQDLKKE